MANYVSSARSNYFQVKDFEKFMEWINQFSNLHVDRDPEGRVVILETYGEGWPTWRDLEEPYEYETQDGRKMWMDDEEVDFADELSMHLAEGEVAVLEEAGAEKLRYVAGHAVAVNHNGDQLHVDLADIYEKIKEAGWGETTSATY